MDVPAQAASHKHRQKQFLPPSPPLSPPTARRRHKRRHDDEFAKLAATPLPSPTLSAAFDKEDKPEPLLTRIVLTPVLFTSFLFSLFLVNAQDRARRAAAHTPPSSYLAYLFPSAWLDPEPYQDHSDSTWGRRGAAGHVEPHGAVAPKPGQLDGAQGDERARTAKDGKRKRSWHLNKKIGKMARLEVSDAFDSQGKVVVVMMATMVFGVIGLWVGMRWIWRSMFG
ncbi:uncharacterized protein EKO05_0008335 [Ascochyta rabiei]|uniref:Uncharacterized protein n=1 Tax=Didymella rabiei TaxID=5454 RepID=A0A163DKL4_DIDRA|nr:uncharacterized protein EKO05_0008335 [Ascochyta rabiei]KZM23218.1 hypothetical protein ST47_g5713 [Ascochyta rabiei]UPX18011.1 hypothetical protein EKO05_0008335 [Ascochyta rabiei]